MAKTSKPKIVMMDPRDLIPYENNARDNREAIPVVESSIAEFGFLNPVIVDSENVIIAGHSRREASINMGLTEIPVIVASHLTKDQADAFRLVDNKSAELAGWDFDLMDAEIARLAGFDFTSFGFTFDMPDVDFGSYGARDEDEDEYVIDDDVPDGSYEGGADHDDTSPVMGDLRAVDVDVAEFRAEDEFVVPEELPAETRTQRGDVLIMGPHRVYCGDSTDAESFRIVLEGETADIAFTSPPYNAGNIGREGRSNEGAKYLNDPDRRTDEEYTDFLCSVLQNMLGNCEEVFYNIGMVSGSKVATCTMCERFKGNFKDMVYWFKTNPIPSIAKGVISSGVEPIYAFGRNPSRAFRKELGIFNGVIHCPANTHNQYADVHKAVFPYNLPLQLVERFTEPGWVVMDPFGGVGTTLLACEELGRKARLIEIEPAYCDIIARRYQEMGGEVLLQRDGMVVPF